MATVPLQEGSWSPENAGQNGRPLFHPALCRDYKNNHPVIKWAWGTLTSEILHHIARIWSLAQYLVY